MAWVDKSPHVRIRRTYACSDCNNQFKAFHDSPDEPAPNCPFCAQVSNVTYIAPHVAQLTNKSKAVDYAQRMAEEDYGLTNMRDNQREGDTAIMAPDPMQTAERETLVRDLIEAGATEAAAAMAVPEDLQKAAKNVWQGALPTATGPQQTTLAQVAPISAQQKAQGVDAVGILERGRETGSMKLRLPVVGNDRQGPSTVLI